MRILTAMLAFVLAAPAMAQPVVNAPAGAVRGEGLADGINVFRGLPYVQPPVGPLRWRPPAALPRWRGTRDATQFGPVCVQPAGRPGSSIYYAPLPAMSEDCLTLNIWVPANARNAPVFVWIHGGALIGGAGSGAVYDGVPMARRGVIVDTINYRLGVLGYLAHPALSAESREHVSGNYGLLDQIAALRWVRRNIWSVGGNPANVTIAGESAGALSVMYLMTAPQARGLFAKAIMQSAYMFTAPELRTTRYSDVPAEVAGTRLASQLGASNLAALRAMRAEDLVNRSAPAGYYPFLTVDGLYVPDQLVTILDRGRQARVPVLAGFNSGEIRSLPFLAPPPPADAPTYEATIRRLYGDLADDYLRVYPAGNLAETMLLAPRDAVYGWTSERLAAKQTAIGVPGFLYYFDHGYPSVEALGLHAFHGSEIPFVFGSIWTMPPAWPQVPHTPAERALSDAMLDYWTSFARSGRPTAQGQPDWQPYGSARSYMAFADVPRPGTHLLPGMYELNERVMCRRRAAGGIPWNWNVGIVSPPLPAAAPGCR
jgi:para-nitrobenzyl esterase